MILVSPVQWEQSGLWSAYTICLIVRQLFKSLSMINNNYDAWPRSNYNHAINMLEVMLEHKGSLSSTKVSADSRMCITVTINGSSLGSSSFFNDLNKPLTLWIKLPYSTPFGLVGLQTWLKSDQLKRSIVLLFCFILFNYYLF